ncbi:uncharacterized protein LOC127841476 isoform X2 [Dreissena polymorpha]|uniref:C2H2-type domain-containing protein n=2 Tax=Dreissena polymorpha TaxID=45954 RepID=A0A9D4IX62_DREPO|nr:uncharacterized protein LOC127841476 isoform X2 [Dreissena polymorpha]KAH3787852.1 hypothetical protein DPMN_165983 [Dreissena polymorpha]
MSDDDDDEMCDQEHDGAEEDVDMISRSDDITSSQPGHAATQSTATCPNGGSHTGDLVSSVSDTGQIAESTGSDQPCDCSSSSTQSHPTMHRTDTVAHSSCSQSECDASGTMFEPMSQSDSVGCPSDTESEIVVDDSPSVNEISAERLVSSNSVSDREDIDIGREGSVRPLNRSRSVTPSPSYLRLATPSTPGTPRLRSGSVSGVTFSPVSPKPTARGTPTDRQRSGSMGEIEMRERMSGRVKINDGLDILQLPRPRNPGGILPFNGHSSPDNLHESNEALNLTIEPRQLKDKSGNSLGNGLLSSYKSESSTSGVTSSSKHSNTSYMISNIMRTTPNKNKPSTISSYNGLAGRRQGCAINETVERPKPSSVIDSEGIAKKIARIDNAGFLCTSTSDTVWNRPRTNVGTARSALPGICVISSKTPPERPKPPRRTVLSPADNGHPDMASDRYVSSSDRRRLIPSNSHTSGNRDLVVSRQGAGDGFETPDVCLMPHNYKCRMCSYSAGSFHMLQMHSTKHRVSSKTFRCALCDYTTIEKSNLRRHRRLHHKSSPVNTLKCTKCLFTTSLSRKMRDHYQQEHPDLPASTLLPALNSGVVSPPGFPGQPSVSMETDSSYPPHYYNNSLLINNRSDRLGYPYSITGRHPQMNVPYDQFGLPFGGYRDRHSETMASNYLRSMVTSIMNSEVSSRHAPATSTVTSSDYYMPHGVGSSQIQDVHTCSHTSCGHGSSTPNSGVKVKVETDLDISSCALSSPRLSRPLSDQSVDNRHENTVTPSSVLDSSVTSNTDSVHRDDLNAADVPTDLSSALKQPSVSGTSFSSSHGQRISRINLDSVDLENGHDKLTHSIVITSMPSVSDTVVKMDTTTRGVQCVLPLIKTEITLDGDYFDFYSRPRFMGVDQGVQCNLSNSSNPNNPAALPNRSQPTAIGRHDYRSQSLSESDNSEHQSSFCAESRCHHCGISFDDEVIFSIHIGCHSHTDPFKCNVCGKQCGNKYGFYSHIMRGHHS